jgi:UMF1 family MFS transporter
MLYGTALVFYNSFLPILVDHHPKLQSYLSQPDTCADSPEAVKLSEQISNFVSTRGLGLGYAGGVLYLVITLAVLMFVDGSANTMKLFIAISGVWWFVFSLYSMKHLKARPGPDLPSGENYIFFSWKKSTFVSFSVLETPISLLLIVIRSFSHCRRLPNNFLFLLSYLIYADAYGTICTVAIIFGKTSLEMTASECVILATITPVFALIGVFFFHKIQGIFRFSTKTMLLSILVLMALIPAYGAIGLATTKFGIHHKIELYIVGSYYGMLLGAIQSYSRVLYSELIPPGYESEFFSMYQITDKGGSWIGPLFVALLADMPGGNIRYSFLFLLGMLLLAIPLVWRVDVGQGKSDAIKYSNKELARGHLS